MRLAKVGLAGALAAAGFLVACQGAPQNPVVPALVDAAAGYVQEHYQSPEDYVVAQFADHDLVLLGEFHRLQPDVLLVQALIPRLPANGVHTLAIEFANASDQALIDRLVDGEEYDESLARELSFHSFLSIGLGGYQEYTDLFRAAWKVNRSRRADEPKFRVLGINNTNDWSVLQTRADEKDGTKRALVFGNQTEGDWARRVLETVVAKNEKALIYCGLHHAFTRYRQPQAGARFGNLLFEAVGDRAMTVVLHSAWQPAVARFDGQYVLAADGAIDRVIAALPASEQRFGVDVSGTPWGAFSGRSSAYSQGYDSFTLADFCDGYLCQGPLERYQAVTPIPLFVNPGNLTRAQQGFPNTGFRTASAAQFNQAIAEDTQVFHRLTRTALEGLRP